MRQQLNAIIIDDNKVNLRVAEMVLQSTGKIGHILKFQYAGEALEFIVNGGYLDGIHCVIFCDMQMPLMTGMEFADKFALLSEKVKDGYTLDMTSASIDAKEIQEAEEHPAVKHFLSMPFTTNQIPALLDKMLA